MFILFLCLIRFPTSAHVKSFAGLEDVVGVCPLNSTSIKRLSPSLMANGYVPSFNLLVAFIGYSNTPRSTPDVLPICPKYHVLSL